MFRLFDSGGARDKIHLMRFPLMRCFTTFNPTKSAITCGTLIYEMRKPDALKSQNTIESVDNDEEREEREPEHVPDRSKRK